ncbi:MAG: carbohydrate ABC transporter permease [Lachnospiraceae bacterium]|nr:carbohydrate ABC transporter permease [Lachnospiraceae bacterium]
MKKKLTFKKVITKTLFILCLLVFIVFICLPIYWCLATSLKTQPEVISKNVVFWPAKPYWQNYVDAWIGSDFRLYFGNSLFKTLFGVVGIVLVSLLTGYALDRYKFKGKNAFMLALLCTQFIPGAMLLTPMYLIFRNLKMLDSLWALVLVDITFRFPYDSIMMRSFIHGIDYTIEEAAQIDGCSRIGTMFRVLLPLLKPGIATVAAYAFISCWNEFLYSYMFIDSMQRRTIPVALNSLIGEFSVNYGKLAAGAIIAVVPTILLFSYVQKHLVGGIAAGAVKG